MAVERNGKPARQRSTARSVRLAPEEDARLRQAAKALGVTPSNLLREAVVSRCDAILGGAANSVLDEIIGAIDVPGMAARDAKIHIADEMEKKHAKRRRLS